MCRPKLSVVVPIYNTGNYVEKCVQSILDGQNVNLEVIAIDDGSTDNSYDIIKKMADNDERIKIVHQENLGVSYTRNRGIEIAKGEYVTFVDSDDYVEQDTYSYLINNMEKTNADACIYAFCRVFDNKKQDDLLPWDNLTELTNEKIKSILIPKMIGEIPPNKTISGSVCRSVFKRTVINNLRFNEKIRIQEDLLFCIYAYAKCQKIIIVNDVKYNYIKHGITTTEKYRNDYYKESLYFEDKIVTALKDIGIFQLVFNKYQSKRIGMYSLCLSNLFRFDAPNNYKNDINEIFNGFKEDVYLKNKVKMNILTTRKKLIYILLKLNSKRLICYIYKNKEQKRHKKLKA